LSFRLKALQNAPLSHNAEFLLTITDHQTINLVKPFTLRLGKVPVAIVHLSSGSGSASAMKAAIDGLQVPCEFLATLPSRTNLYSYSTLFVSLGTTSGNIHTLTTDESNKLANYLFNGGKLYMEGYPTWYFRIRPLFILFQVHSPSSPCLFL